MTEPDVEEIFRTYDEEKADREKRMPDDHAALLQMFDAYLRLKELGWKDAIYCPKDGSYFDAIEVGSTGTFRCYYEGSWPNGAHWVEDGGDLWPSRPILFRPIRNGVSSHD